MTQSSTEGFLPEQVILNLEGTFDDCLCAFEPVVCASPAVSDSARFLKEVRAREQSAPTATVHGIAFPHARSDAVRQIFVIAGRSSTGIDFGSGVPPVHLVFLIGTPPNAVAEYLGLLAGLTRRMRDSNLRDQLIAADTCESFLATGWPNRA